MNDFAKTLIFSGLILIGMGILAAFFSKIPMLGHRLSILQYPSLLSFKTNLTEGRMLGHRPSILQYPSLFSFKTNLTEGRMLGKLPGDIFIRRGSFTFYFPITTCVLLSFILTLVLTIFGKK